MQGKPNVCICLNVCNIFSKWQQTSGMTYTVLCVRLCSYVGYCKCTILSFPRLFLISSFCAESGGLCYKCMTIWTVPSENIPSDMCACNEDSDQPARSLSLIRIFTERLLDSQWYKVSSCAQLRLSRVCTRTGRVESLLGAHDRKDISRVERKTSVSQMVVFPQT